MLLSLLMLSFLVLLIFGVTPILISIESSYNTILSDKYSGLFPFTSKDQLSVFTHTLCIALATPAIQIICSLIFVSIILFLWPRLSNGLPAIWLVLGLTSPFWFSQVLTAYVWKPIIANGLTLNNVLFQFANSLLPSLSTSALIESDICGVFSTGHLAVFIVDSWQWGLFSITYLFLILRLNIPRKIIDLAIVDSVPRFKMLSTLVYPSLIQWLPFVYLFRVTMLLRSSDINYVFFGNNINIRTVAQEVKILALDKIRFDEATVQSMLLLIISMLLVIFATILLLIRMRK